MSAEFRGYDAKDHEYFRHGRSDVVALLSGNPSCVIDIGGASGATLSLIKQRYPEAKTICVDGHAPSLAIAARNGHIAVECNLDHELPGNIAEGDVVLCLDVLEHLVDPWTVLSNIRDKMRPGAKAIVSLPNVRFLPVSAGLLFAGNWKLTDAGVLDRTHLRFFTYKSAIELFTGAGLSVTALRTNIGFGRKGLLVNLLTLGLFRDLLSVQFLIVGTK